MAINNATAVLVHGAWADGSSWAKVIIALAASGVKAVAAPPAADIVPRRRRGARPNARAGRGNPLSSLATLMPAGSSGRRAARR